MLIAESEKARVLRQVILDIVIDTINQKTGGGTKYINQRDEEFLTSWFEEENYRKQFTGALKNYMSMGTAKYAIYTNKILVKCFAGIIAPHPLRKLFCPLRKKQLSFKKESFLKDKQ